MRAFHWPFAAALLLLVADSARCELKIENIQAAYARFGPIRKSLTVTGQDEVFFYFDIVGVQTDKEGKIDQVIHMEIIDPNGKTALNKDSPIHKELTLGGDRLPGMASVSFGAAPAPGSYTLTVTATDKVSGGKASFQRTLTCQAGGFHIVAPQFFYDAEGNVPAPVGGVAGQTLYVRLKAVGLKPGAEKLETAMSLQLLDSQGKETMPKPLLAEIREEDPTKIKQVQFVTFTASLVLTRPGDFTLRIAVEDRVGKQTAQFEAPLHVNSLPVAAGP